MLKPHVGIAFAALFLFNRQWRGLLFGLAILAGLTMVALWWTAVPVGAFATEWLVRAPMRFTAEPEGFSPGRIAQWLGWNHRVVSYAAIGVVLAALAALAVTLRKIRVADLLLPAAICAVLGRLLIYHRPYDQVMLWPLLLACLAVALRARTVLPIALAAAVGCTLWTPLRLQLMLPFGYATQSVIWTCAAAYLALRLVASQRARKASS